jgi:hypothetical protein
VSRQGQGLATWRTNSYPAETDDEMSFLADFWSSLPARKYFWLLLFGGLVILTQGSAAAPFIYTIF